MTKTAQQIIKARGGQWFGTYGVCRCPSHDDARPSLSVSEGRDGRVLVHCHAGCQRVKVLADLRDHGLQVGAAGEARPGPCRKELDQNRQSLVEKIWNKTRPAGGSIVTKYLASRGITIETPLDLRFHQHLRHPTGEYGPAMVGAVRDVDGKITGLHRTWITATGKANLFPQKAMLGRCRGGAVRFAAEADELCVVEGIESGLSVMQATGRPTWAALSTSGIIGLVLPASVRSVIIAADGDPSGEAAAQAAAQRWEKESRSVRIARPPAGLDFNDLLRRGRA
jgi:phage/plasmid primase-like uncharacterized protein